MPLFSFTKSKRDEPLPEISRDGQFEVAQEAVLEEPKSTPKASIISRLLFFRARPKITTTLVQGASDSKPNCQNARQDRASRLATSMGQNLNVNNAQSLYPDLNSMYQEQLSKSVKKSDSQPNCQSAMKDRGFRLVTSVEHNHNVNNVQSLYPDLNSTYEEQLSKSVQKSIKVTKLKLIHDIVEDICFVIQPRILQAKMVEKQHKRFESNIQEKVRAVLDILKNSQKFEYPFETELGFEQNYAHVKVVEELRTFNDVKTCDQKINKLVKSQISYDAQVAPIFPRYYDNFRCYRGRSGDIIDCD